MADQELRKKQRGGEATLRDKCRALGHEPKGGTIYVRDGQLFHVCRRCMHWLPFLGSSSAVVAGFFRISPEGAE